MLDRADWNSYLLGYLVSNRRQVLQKCVILGGSATLTLLSPVLRLPCTCGRAVPPLSNSTALRAPLCPVHPWGSMVVDLLDFIMESLSPTPRYLLHGSFSLSFVCGFSKICNISCQESWPSSEVPTIRTSSSRWDFRP